MIESKKSLILLVDDTPSNINLLVSVFEGDYEIAVATSGAQALEMVKELPPDLILLDVMMPEMDGFEVCQQLKKDLLTHHIPVIFLTASFDQDSIVQGFEVGGVDYITKPFQVPELRARVNTHIQFHQMKRLLKICSYCNKILDGEEWQDVASYISKETGMKFTHGVCPRCYEKAMKEMDADP